MYKSRVFRAENINDVDKVAVDHLTGLASVEGDEAIRTEVRYITLCSSLSYIIICAFYYTTPAKNKHMHHRLLHCFRS